MKFNFRKIASVLASAVMIGSTLGIAAAANYPAPFVAGGAANVAVVYGSTAATSDLLAATDIAQNLQVELAKQTATTGTSTGGSVTGEAVALFTGGSKLYLNDTLNTVKSTLTKTDMPTLLADGAFSGNVDATYTETIVLGASPKITYDKAPTSSDEPSIVLSYASAVLYGATTTFNKAVNLTHADSKNQELTLFGKKFTVGSATTTTDLVLLKEATTLDFDSSGTTSQEVTIGGSKYTVEMVSASATTATVKVTNEAGTSEQKEITEGGNPKKVNGLSVAVNTADTNNLKYTASIVAGSEKVTLTDGQAITYGESNTQLDGTIVDFDGTVDGRVDTTTKLTINVSASEADKDATKDGQKFVDPLFGTFSIDFAGTNIPEDSTAREIIAVKPSGDDKITLDVTDSRGNAKTGFQWAMNLTNKLELQHDSSGHNITVAERGLIKVGDMAVVGNEDEGRLIQVTSIVNKTGDNSDTVTWKDVFTGESTTVTATSEAAGDLNIGGKVYTFAITAAPSTTASDARSLRLQYPDSSGTTEMIIYPTIQTSKGAKLMFYEPLTIALENWDGAGGRLGTIKVPNGADNYQSITIATVGPGNFTVDGTAVQVAVGGNITVPVSITNTGLKLNFTTVATANNQTTIYLIDPKNSANILDPALVLIEEKDDNNRYESVIVTLAAGASSTTSLKVNDAIRTWGSDGVWNGLATVANSNIVKEADLFGTIISLDGSSAQEKSATISYPDEQVYAQIYLSKGDATITPGETTSGSVVELGSVTVKDTEVSQVSSKNLLVVGGSCINTVAAKILGSDSALCGAAFTTSASNVGADQALIKVVKNPYLGADTTQVAMLIAGYEGADTTKAAKYVTTSKPSTAVGEIKLSTSGTVATIAS